MKHAILIVEDDIAFGTMLQKWFNRKGMEAVLCARVATAQEQLVLHSYSLVLSDLRLPDGDGIGLLHWMRERKLQTPVLVMTGYGEVRTAVAAIKLGAEDFLEKPINPSVLLDKIDQILIGNDPVKKTIVSQNQTPVVLGTSIAFNTLYTHVKKVAPTNMSVLILGESGTGKEYVARMIHQLSARAENPFVAVDCGSLSKELAPSELFGHLKGAFTSAVGDKTGVFEQAKGGTVFLDEVGNLSYEIQVQLLRALQERMVRPVGAVNDVRVDVRILAATNENLESAMLDGRFREDLYYRLNEFSVTVPSLRERREDIAIFVNAFLHQANEELQCAVSGFSPQALILLEQYQWPGNLRELRNLIRRLVLFADEDVISASQLAALLPDCQNTYLQKADDERLQIEQALLRARGNKTMAAQLLCIDRKTLYNKMHLYGIKL